MLSSCHGIARELRKQQVILEREIAELERARRIDGCENTRRSDCGAFRRRPVVSFPE